MGADYQHYPFPKGEHPPGWMETTVGEVMLEIRSGYSSGKHNQSGQGIPHLRPMNVSPEGEISMKDVRYVSPDVGSMRLAENDVLFTNTSSTVWVGKTALVQNPGEWGFSNHMTRLRVANGMSPEFVARQLHYLCISGYFAFHCKKHINQSSISGKQLIENIPFRLPPTNEQKRIIDKLRSLLVRERRLRQELDTLPALIQQYREAVLEAAFTGRLVPTEAELARKEHRDFEPASVLLHRILKERRIKWEADQLAKMRAAGKEPKDDGWKKRYREPLKPQIDSLPPLPSQWCWAGTEELTAGIENAMTIGPFGSDLKVRDFRESGVPLIFVREVRSENFNRDDTRYISGEKAKELARHTVRGGDVLITKMGEPPGDTSIYPDGFPDAIATSDCIKLTPNLSATSAAFLKYIIRSQIVRDQIAAISRGVAQQKVSLTRFKTVAIPLPPRAEQSRIVDEIERCFAALSYIEEQVKAALKQAAQLRVSLFQRAFSGGFVKQRKSDETAQELLARIRIASRLRRQTKTQEVHRTMKKKIQISEKRGLLEVLDTHAEGMPPDQLMQEAGYAPNEVPAFFLRLREIEGQILETRPARKVVILKRRHS